MLQYSADWHCLWCCHNEKENVLEIIYAVFWLSILFAYKICRSEQHHQNCPPGAVTDFHRILYSIETYYSGSTQIQIVEKLSQFVHTLNLYSNGHLGWRRLRAPLNPSNAELNPICHLLALLGAHHIFHVSRVRLKRWAKSHVLSAGIIRSSPYSPR